MLGLLSKLGLAENFNLKKVSIHKNSTKNISFNCEILKVFLSRSETRQAPNMTDSFSVLSWMPNAMRQGKKMMKI